jgi:predicted HTH transcriptional regulator
LNERQARALEYLKAYGQITRSEYCELTGVQKSTAHQGLQSMISKGIVVRQGKERGARYVWNRPAADDSPDD